MYTILMQDDKNLIATSRTTLRQYESLVDKIQFIIPQMYGDINFFTDDYQIVLKYVDQANIPYTVFLDKEVPEVLLSGHHENIRKWRHEQSVKRTKERRPDLWEAYEKGMEEKDGDR